MSNQVEEKIRNISKTYSLRIDQASLLEDQIMYVMLGLEKPALFTKNLKEGAMLDDVKINGIVKDIEESIFKPIQQDLIKVTSPGYVPPPETEDEGGFEEYKKDVIEIWGEEGKKALEKYEGSIVDKYEDEINAEVERELARRQAERLTAELSQKQNPTPDQTIDLRSIRNVRKDSPIESKGALDSEIMGDTPYTTSTPNTKTRPSDGTEKIEEHPEEYLSYPYKPEDHQTSEHDVDFDLDEFEPKKPEVTEPENKANIIPTKATIPPAPIKKESDIAKIANDILIKPEAETVPENDKVHTPLVSEPFIGEDFKSESLPEKEIVTTEAAPENLQERSILMKNLQEPQVVQKKVTTVSDDAISTPTQKTTPNFSRQEEHAYGQGKADPYRTPIE